MGKPLKSKNLKASASLRSSVLARQGVKLNKRTRLGHTGHFGKVTEIPVDRKPKTKGNKHVPIAKDGSQRDVERTERSHDEEAKVGKRGFVMDSEGDSSQRQSTEKRAERLPGESFCKFMKRLNRETMEKLIEQSAKARKVSTKRKEHLAKRKDKKKDIKENKVIKTLRGKDEDDTEYVKEQIQERLKQEEKTFVRFGEQADRPPLIKLAKPLKGLQKQVAHDSRGYVVGGLPVIPELSGAERSKREFEALRNNAIALYRQKVQQKRAEKGHVSLGQMPKP